MGTEQQGAVTGTVTDKDIAKLYLGLQLLNGSIETLNKASILSKSSAADEVLNDARDFMANQAFTIHKLFNEQNRINARLEWLSEWVKSEVDSIRKIGVIKNG